MNWVFLRDKAGMEVDLGSDSALTLRKGISYPWYLIVAPIPFSSIHYVPPSSFCLECVIDICKMKIRSF